EELENGIALATKLGDKDTARKYEAQLADLRKGPSLTIQERAQLCHARIKQLEEALGVEVGKLDTYQSWVRTQTECVKKLELALAEADGECTPIVSELADK
ncbi:unnamed protein product, partial [Prorocentrum cordatum]